MALLSWKAPVDYQAQLDAFQSFLDKFEVSKTAQEEAAEAIDGLHLDGDHTSDEYDFMDDAEDEGTNNATNRRRPNTRKYRQMLQEVADRERTNITIELDDLKEVSSIYSMLLHMLTWVCVVRGISRERFQPEVSRFDCKQYQTLCRSVLRCR